MRKMLPFDIWLCLALSCLLAFGTGALAGWVVEARYRVHDPVTGEVGGPAGPEVVRVQSVEELLEQERFTVIVPNGALSWGDKGYYREGYTGHLMNVVTLPSGERVAAWVNSASIQQEDENDHSTYAPQRLPVGRVVYEDLASNSELLHGLERNEPLSRHDFYIDMAGNTVEVDHDEVLKIAKTTTQVITGVVCFPLFHAAGSMLGLWKAFFRPKKKKEESMRE